ncbi:MAG: iron-sulfur cluster assembly accessory protein, partial [Nanoarchaeota archaeon]
GNVFEQYPQKAAQLAEVMTAHGLHCVGCHVNVFETIEQGILGHDMDTKQLDSLLKGMNEVLMRKEEPITGGIRLTPAAVEKVKELQKKEKKHDMGLRVAVEAGGCAGFSYALYFDKAMKGDTVIKQAGIQVYIQPDAAQKLQGSEIDYVDGLQGAGFKFNNPNAKKACGCGHSAGF